MLGMLQFIQQVLSTPAIFVGLIALLGLLLQRQDAQTCVKGTIKTILGFIVLNAGAQVFGPLYLRQTIILKSVPVRPNGCCYPSQPKPQIT